MTLDDLELQFRDPDFGRREIRPNGAIVTIEH